MAGHIPQSTAFSIRLNGISKKFDSNWIFKNVDAVFEGGEKYAITGYNGSGKSTLLKIIAGIVTPNQGEISFELQGQKLETEEVYRHVTYCAPYLELPEELNLAELMKFHQSLRKLTVGAAEIITELQIDPKKEIRHYSSGMKQRLKLALAFYTTANVLLLDEPTATLDEHWSNWYLQKVQNTAAHQLVVICSNHPPEYAFCKHRLNVTDYAV